MKGFIAVGNTPCLVELIELRRDVLMCPETRLEFEALLATVQMMSAFEKKYGRGACMPVDDEDTFDLVNRAPEVYDAADIANALAAPQKERARILAAVPKF
jgi:hypothetical protein